MSLTRQDVEKIAHLARLSITEQEMPVYVTSLSNMREPQLVLTPSVQKMPL